MIRQLGGAGKGRGVVWVSSITLRMGGRRREGTFPSGLVANFSGTQLLVSFINLLFVSKKYF